MKLERKHYIAIAVVVAIIIIIILIMLARRSKTDDKKNPDHVFLNAGNLKVQNITIAPKDGQTQVSWAPINGADHYTMYYSEKKGFTKETANTHNPITVNEILLASDVPREYYFRVTASKKVDGKLVESQVSDEYKMSLDVVPN